jgi:hypothetical protein
MSTMIAEWDTNTRLGDDQGYPGKRRLVRGR